jgi:DNA-binding transcriptional regulator YdaS (Cro superfamily)
MSAMNAIERAIDIAGGQSALARALGGSVKQAHVWYWKENGEVPPEHCIAIEIATEGKVSRYELRPDVFGPEPASASPSPI